jgi:chromosome condensin MukBEF ATPase and DNA-binding subunit MukB
MTPISHLRSRIDALAWRVEQADNSAELRTLSQECNELERAIQAHENDLKREVAEMESAKMHLHRLKARL